MVDRVRPGTVRVEGGKLLAKLSEAECTRLKPELDLLKAHLEEVAQLLAEPDATPAKSMTAPEPDSPIPEPDLPETPATTTTTEEELQKTTTWRPRKLQRERLNFYQQEALKT